MAEKVENYLIKNKNSAEPVIAEIWQKLEQFYVRK